jgi:hypothetical protein
LQAAIDALNDGNWALLFAVNATNVTIRLLSSAAVFLQLEGAENENIKIDGGDISKAAPVLSYKNGATKKAVQLRD